MFSEFRKLLKYFYIVLFRVCTNFRLRCITFYGSVILTLIFNIYHSKIVIFICTGFKNVYRNHKYSIDNIIENFGS